MLVSLCGKVHGKMTWPKYVFLSRVNLSIFRSLRICYQRNFL